MATGWRRAVRVSAGVSAGIACVLMAGVWLAPASRPTHLRGAVDPIGSGLATHVIDPLATATEGQPPRIVLGPNGRDVRLSGELTEGTTERLARLLAEAAGVERIHLTSEGGLVDEGTAIGALVARYRLVTYVPDYCVSACTLAFVRGRERLVVAQARLGFHAPYETGPFGIEIAADSAPERAAYLAAGVGADFVDAALKVRPDDLMIPDPETLVRAGVATGIVDAYRFPDSTLDDGADPDRARSAILRDVPLLGAVEAAAPGTVEAVAAWYLAGYREGRSEGEAVDGIQRMAARAIARSLGGAEPAALVDLGRLTLQALQRPNGSAACAAAGEGIGAVLTRTRLGKAERAAARTILAHALGLRPSASPAPDRAAAEADSDAMSARAVTGTPCAALRKAFAAALARSRPEAAEALRPLLFPEPSPGPRPALEASAQPR